MTAEGFGFCSSEFMTPERSLVSIVRIRPTAFL